ncbi:MAG: hypothetical protein ACOYOB_19595 [Myxococcota bacterium]
MPTVICRTCRGQGRPNCKICGNARVVYPCQTCSPVTRKGCPDCDEKGQYSQHDLATWSSFTKPAPVSCPGCHNSTCRACGGLGVTQEDGNCLPRAAC